MRGIQPVLPGKYAVAMSRSPRQRRAIVAVLLIGIVGLPGCEPLGPDELKREVDSIHSVAAEGAVLAHLVADQDTKRTLARVQARELADAAEHSAERLIDAHPADGIEASTATAVDLAGRVSDAIGEIEQAPDDVSAASGAAERLRRLAAQTDSLSGSL
jgi:hypothetical protein